MHDEGVKRGTPIMPYITANSALFAPAPGTPITVAERDQINAANAAARPAPTDYTADELFAAMFD